MQVASCKFLFKKDLRHKGSSVYWYLKLLNCRTLKCIMASLEIGSRTSLFILSALIISAVKPEVACAELCSQPFILFTYAGECARKNWVIAAPPVCTVAHIGLDFALALI